MELLDRLTVAKLQRNSGVEPYAVISEQLVAMLPVRVITLLKHQVLPKLPWNPANPRDCMTLTEPARVPANWLLEVLGAMARDALILQPQVPHCWSIMLLDAFRGDAQPHNGDILEIFGAQCGHGGGHLPPVQRAAVPGVFSVAATHPPVLVHLVPINSGMESSGRMSSRAPRSMARSSVVSRLQLPSAAVRSRLPWLRGLSPP